MTRDEELGLFTVINKARALQGWSLAPATELEPICRVWWKEFSRHRIPPEHYETLFQRALDARVRSLNEGAKHIPNIDAITMISCWQGLSAEIEQQRINDRRYLPSTAASDCQRCYGSGMEVVPGKGARHCDHEPVIEKDDK